MHLKNSILELWQQGKTYREIANELDTNLSKVCRVLKAFKAENNAQYKLGFTETSQEVTMRGIKNEIKNLLNTFLKLGNDLPVTLKQHETLETKLNDILDKIELTQSETNFELEIIVLELIESQIEINIRSMEEDEADSICFQHNPEFAEMLALTALFHYRDETKVKQLLEACEKEVREFIQSTLNSK